MSPSIDYQDGTIVVDGVSDDVLPDGFVWDRRVSAYRAPADRYRTLIYALLSAGIRHVDNARDWTPLPDLKLRASRTPRVYQTEAVSAWMEGKRGTIVLPTGSGKTFVAELIIASLQRPTLVVAPTLDLVSQWRERLRLSFGIEVGAMGGGEHTILPITVSTYDSAQLHLSRYGNRFALIVYDEVHHLPAEQNLLAASGAMAPFRLGLTATLERQDGREELLVDALGPEVYRKEINDLSGDFLADYDVTRLFVDLLPSEAEEYRQARETYLKFLRQKRISVSGPNGWRRFIRAASRSKMGREAMAAHAKSKRIIQSSEAKINILEDIIAVERERRVIVFTSDNFTAYRVSAQFLAPCITHQTDLKERSQILKDFTSGLLPLLITSRVLNEGVDLPAAEVAVVLSGSGTVREHVQRLGRILRPQAGKKALMYEVVASDTSEESTSARRRRHDAYQ